MRDPDRGQDPNRASAPRAIHDALTRLLSIAMLAIGAALAARGTLLAILLGLLFIAAGVGRLYVQLRTSPGRRTGA